ncbi:hypothetical protein Tco_0105096 [Tanacetum coccineum]
MDTTRAQQKALDDDLVPTLQVVLDARKLTSFYKAFEITADVLEIYMQEFWVTVSRHHSSLRQKFEDPPFEEEILSFIRDLRHTGEIKVLSDVNVNHMHQPWRSYAAIINKCLSGKTTALERLRLSHLVFQVENKNSKKNNDMYYPRFTKVIVDYFMVKDHAIPRRNKMFWHFARDDSMFITVRVIFKHQDTHVYGAILPQHLTNQAMLEYEAYKTYHAYATGKKIPKPKYVKNKADLESSPKKKSTQASKGKRIKSSTKVAKPFKKKQPTTTSNEKGLNVLSETHSSHTSGSGADEGTDVILGVPDVPTYNSDDEQISWKCNDEDDDDEVNVSEDDDDLNDDNADNEGDDGQDDDNEHNKSNNDDDDLVHPKLSTFNEKEREDKEDKEEEWSDDEAYDDETQGVNFEGEELDEEETNKEDEVNELYRDVNVNLEGRDTEMIYALQTNIQDVPVTTNVKMPPSSVTTLPPPPIPLFQPQQQTPVPIPIIAPSSSLQNLPTFDSIFKFEDRVNALEDDFSEFKQTNQFAATVSLILDRLRNEAQAENEDFINTLDENMRKIIRKQVKEQVKEQVSKILPKIEKFVNDQLEAEVLTRSSNQAKTSHVVVANLSELELKKILIDKMENNKSIDRSIQQKTLYNALVDAYETNKDIFETYRDIFTFKRRRDDEDEDEEPSAGSNRGSAQVEEPIHADEDLEEPAHQELDTRFTEDQPVDETTQHQDWESNHDVYSTHRILVVTKLKIIKWHNYKHLDWITVHRNDDKLYTFKEGDYNRLRLQDIEDMLLLLVQGKLTNLNVEERLALGVESYQKKLNLTRPDTYRSDLKQKTPYTAYSNPKGFIYQNKDKKNRLIRIDELHKFSDGTLNDVRSALDDILKRIRMEYLPQTVWRNVDERAGGMIQAIDRQLKNRRLLRSLEKFVVRRLYGGDLRLLERTI